MPINEDSMTGSTMPRQEMSHISISRDPFQELSSAFGGGPILDNLDRTEITDIKEQAMSDEVIDTTESPDVTKVMEYLKRGKQLHDKIATKFREEYLIAGKLMAEWKEHFQLRIPPDLNPRLCEKLDAKMMELHQEASFFKADCESRLAAFQSSNMAMYRAKYTSLCAEYQASGKKLPAKDTLQVLAEKPISDYKDAVIHAEIELAFWKEILNDLRHARKLVENASLNLSVEAKALRSEQWYDNINKEPKQHTYGE